MKNTQNKNFAKKGPPWPKKPKQEKRPKLPITLYGQHAVREALMNSARKVKAIYLTEKIAPTFEELFHNARKNGIKLPEPKIVTREDLDKTLGADTVHQGVAANIEALPERSLMDLIIADKAKPSSRFVLLDQVTDPHNVGAILRSACAFGFSGMVMQSRFAPPLEGTLAKVASGGLEHIPVALEVNLSRAIELAKEHGYAVYALDERGTKNFKDLEIPAKAMVVMGAEGPGLRPSVRDACTEVVRLEMHGELPSINVSNAAAIAFYALTL